MKLLQRLRRPLVSCFALLLLSLLAAGCTTTKVYKTVGVPDLPPTTMENVKLFELDDKVPQPYQLIGQVTVTRTQRGVPKRSGNKRLRMAAAQLGADAVVEAKLRAVPEGRSLKFYRTGLAVRWSPSPSMGPTPGPFVVAVLPTPEDPEAPGNQTKIARAVFDGVVGPLEIKGFRPMPNGPLPFTGGLEAALELPDDELRALGGQEAHYLLDLNYLSQANVNILIGASAEVGIRARLFEKATRKVVYEGVGAGTGYTGWLLNLTAPNMKRIMAASYGATSALIKLDAVSEEIPKKIQ